MKRKKVFLSILVLALVFGMSYSVSSEVTNVQTFNAIADFYDMEPTLSHPAVSGEKYVDTVISCNMFLKPKTQIHLSRYCESAVSNLNFYFNGSTSDIQKGPDYTNTVEDEVFYPSSGRIGNSYLGGNISYRVGSEFQTKASTGEKINLQTPDEYKAAVIISSKVYDIPDMGQDFTIEQPTGDQSQPDYTATKKGIPSLSGRQGHWVVRFGTLSDTTASGAFSFFKAKKASEKVFIIGGVNAGNLWNGEWLDQEVYGTDIFYENYAQDTTLNEQEMEKCQKAERLLMEYNTDPGACDEFGNVLIEEGWLPIDASQAEQFLKVVDGKLYYPVFDNAWGRIYAMIPEDPATDDYRPVRRTIVKGRIGSKYPGFEFKNMKEGDVLKIYNVNGKKIREITSGTADGFVWDGKNDSGDWAKSGIYIYQIKVNGKLTSGTIVFVY